MARVTGTKAPQVDFDHESEHHAKVWPEEFAQMREQCPVAWTSRHGGYWVATSYEAVEGGDKTGQWNAGDLLSVAV